MPLRSERPRCTIWCSERGPDIPLFIDIHEVAGATPENIAAAHKKDLDIQDTYGVNYVKYWLNQSGGKLFCLCTAPNAEAADKVHREAHGLAAERIIEVDPDLAEGMLGGGAVSPTGAAIVPATGEFDSGVRTILFTDIVGSTELTQRLGERAAMEMLDLHDQIVRAAFRLTNGREVKHLGDGLMGVFSSAEDAIRCAADAHRALRASTARTMEPVRIRVGMAAGVPIERNGDFFGSTVQLAAAYACTRSRTRPSCRRRSSSCAAAPASSISAS